MLPIRALALILLALASFSNRSSSPFVIRMLLMSVLSFVDVGNYLQTCYISHYNISSVIIINVLQFEIFKGMCKTRKRSKRNNPIINRIAFSVSDLDQAIKWYNEILGFTVVNRPVEVVGDDDSKGSDM